MFTRVKFTRVKHFSTTETKAHNDAKVLLGGPGSAFEPYKSHHEELCNSNVESRNSVKCLRKERKNAFHNIKTMFKGKKVVCCLTS